MKQFEKFISYMSSARGNYTDTDIDNLMHELWRVFVQKEIFIMPGMLDEETIKKYGRNIKNTELPQGINFQFIPSCIKSDDESETWYIIYTSPEKQITESHSTMTGYMEFVFDIITSTEDINGFIINPDTDFVPVPRECVESFLAEDYKDIYDMMESSEIVYEFMGEEILQITVDDEPADREDILYYTEDIIESVDCNEISAVIYEFPNGDALQYCGGNGLFDAEYVKMVDDKPYINMFTSPRRADLTGEHTYIYCGEEMSEKNTDLIPSDILMDIIGFALSSDFDYSHPDCVATLCEKLGLTKNVFIITDDGMQQIE